MLLSIGALVFDLKNNIEAYDRQSAQDFARKDVVGARKPYEHVGSGDDIITITGKLFPQRIGARAAMDAARSIMETASPQLVMRGDGKIIGWYLVTKISERGSYLDQEGAPQMVEHELTLERCDQPSAADAFSALLSLFG